MSFLGIDIGTGGCKAVVFSEEGEELAASYRGYSLLRPNHGWAELDSNEVIQKCFEIIREVNSIISDPVQAMCVSSQGEAFTPIDKNGNVLNNAMVSSDSRAQEISASWSKEFGEEKIYRITGHTPHPLFTLYKILWLKKNKPSAWSETSKFLCFEDLFQYKVGIDPHISWPLAGRTMMFDVINHCWNSEILDAIELDSSRLAKPLASGEIAGYIGLPVSRTLGFKNKVMVVAGGHDQTCAALGAGVTKSGVCMYATGTVECFCPMLETSSQTDELRKNNLCCYDFTISGKYTTVAYSLTGGSILQWMRDELGREEVILANEKSLNAYSVLLDQMPEEPTDLLVLPYFSPTGTPYFDSNAKGAIIGLQLTTKKPEITKALLEGVALEMKLNLELMEQSGMTIDSFIATGGGTRNKRWTQLKADVLNKSIVTRNMKEAGCYGAAMLAASAFTGQPVESLIGKNHIDTEIIIPNPVKSRSYDEKFKQYKQLYPVLKQFWKE
jgi:xylulokinase